MGSAMARPPRFQIEALANLVDGLRFAPSERRHAQIEAAIKFSTEIDPEGFLLEDEIVHRITGYRTEMDEPTAFVGWMVQADLSVFIERLSRSLEAPVEDYAHGEPLSADMVCDRLGVSATTLHRYRKQGLIAHQAVWPDGKCRITFFSDLLDQFVAGRSESVRRARRFSRIPAETRNRILKRAQRYHDSLDLSLNEAATRLASRFGRSLEGVRRLLGRHDRAHPEQAIFTHPREPMDPKTQRLLLRASEFGVPVAKLADRFGKSRSSIYRVIGEARAQRLKDWEIEPVYLPTFDLEDAGEVLLSPSIVREELRPIPPLGGDLLEWHRLVENSEPPDSETENHWFGALNYLLHLVAQRRTKLDLYHPRAHDLDDLETYLRWACRLKMKIMSAYLKPALMTIQIHLGQSLLDQPTGEIRRHHARLISALARNVDTFDPTGRRGFEGVMTFSLSRELAADSETGPATRARVRRDAGRVTLQGDVDDLYPWSTLIRRFDRYAGPAAELDPPESRILTLRAGWTGMRPMTHLAISQELGIAPEQVARVEQRALRRCRQFSSASRSASDT